MNPEQTAQSYDKLASHWNSEDFNRENGMEQHRRALQFVETRGYAIDIGCGSSGRIIDWLVSEGFETEGLDVSLEMVRLAKARHPDLVIHLADVCRWDFPKRYDLISAWDSIWHVPLDAQEALLRKLCAALSDRGVLIFTTGGVDQPGEVTNPCMGQPLYHAAPGIPRILEIIAGEACVCRHLEFDQFPEAHLYLIVQKAE